MDSKGYAITLAASALGTVAGVAAAFAPVPWLSPAVSILVGILQLCQNVETNRFAIRQLGRRCEALLVAVRDQHQAQGIPSESLNRLISACEATLQTVKEKMQTLLTIGKVKSFMMQPQINEDIQRCNAEITNVYTAFSIGSQLEIHKWQARFEESQRKDQEETLKYLADIAHNQQITNSILQAQANQLEIIALEVLMQNGLGIYPEGDCRHTGLRGNLHGVQSQAGHLLPDLDLRRKEVRRIGDCPVWGAADFDIWEGEYLGKEKCLIKVLRGFSVSPNAYKRFQREAEIWRLVWEKDRGRYILPFYGFCQNDGPLPYVVSPWMRNGDAFSYVVKYPSVDRKHLIKGIAKGIRLLHTQTPPIVHGDIRGENVMIDNRGNPLLGGFGLSKVIEDITGTQFTQSNAGTENYRWYAPELYVGDGRLSMESDIYSFGMTILELMTGKKPFDHIRKGSEVLFKVQGGQRPNRPSDLAVVERGLNDGLWELLCQCWTRDPLERPTIHQVIASLLQ